jgi:S1-C subfamily serine protease
MDRESKTVRWSSLIIFSLLILILVVGAISSKTLFPADSIKTPAALRGAVQVIASDNETELGADALSVGSGAILAGEEYVLTARHVIWNDSYNEPYPVIELRFPPRDRLHEEASIQVRARLAAEDKGLDLALLQVTRRSEMSGRGLTLMEEGSPEVTSPVMIAGFPSVGGESITVTQGQVAGYMKSGRVMKVDARTGPGASGAPVIGKDGRLVGIVTRVVKANPNNGLFLTLASPSAVLASFLDGQGRGASLDDTGGDQGLDQDLPEDKGAEADNGQVYEDQESPSGEELD